MAGGFVSDVSQVPGQPATVRVGLVESINPMVISVQGFILQAPAVGVLGTYLPTAGDHIILVGQSKQVGVDPSSWVVLGPAVPSGEVLVPPDAETVSAFTAAGNSSVVAGFAALAPPVGVIFTTNPDGEFLVHWRSGFDNTATDTKGVMSWEIRLGGVLGVGAVQVAAGANTVVGALGTNDMEMGATSELQTLAGSTVYNAQLMIARQAGTGTAAFARSGITVQPV